MVPISVYKKETIAYNNLKEGSNPSYLHCTVYKQPDPLGEGIYPPIF